jgi:hypothetical protein
MSARAVVIGSSGVSLPLDVMLSARHFKRRGR